MALHFPRAAGVDCFNPRALLDDAVQQCMLIAACDSDWANDTETARSISGCLITLHGSAIAWRAKMQQVVATSSAHAEYIAASELARELMWARMLLTEIGFELPLPSVTYEDNMAAQLMTQNDGTTDRSKHIHVRWHYVRQCVLDGNIRFERKSSRENPAEALTKSGTIEAINVMASAATYEAFDCP